MIKRMLLALGGVVVATTTVIVPLQASAGSTTVEGKIVAIKHLPGSIAALGDSITRGFNASGGYKDAPGRSWSTGDAAEVNSHYQRLLAENPDIVGKNYNNAMTGAKSDALPTQAQQAVSQGAEYVTILIGANDACTKTEAQMTPVDVYRQHIDQGLAVLKSAQKTPQVFIASVPDLKQLWEAGKNSILARTAWSLLNICQSMLDKASSIDPDDVARRDRVRQRVIDYNTQLAEACKAYGENCRFDKNIVFKYKFTTDQLSNWDYFHPNVSGQQKLAEVTYSSRLARLVKTDS